MDSVLIKAPAKINLLLDVGDLREDGFHEITTVMQAVDLYDDVEIALTEDGTICVNCTDPHIPSGEGNLAYRAAELFRKYIGKDTGAKIHINKRIPSKAGLGGGSSDAAAVLRALNLLCDDPLSASELRRLSEELGSDVPFFIEGGTAFCTGRGEMVKNIPFPGKWPVIIIKPQTDISTGEAYGTLDKVPSRKHYDADSVLNALKDADIRELARVSGNSFFDHLPGDARDIKAYADLLKEKGSVFSLMSGSGSAVYGIFENDKKAEEAFLQIGEKQDMQIFLSHMIEAY